MRVIQPLTPGNPEACPGRKSPSRRAIEPLERRDSPTSVFLFFEMPEATTDEPSALIAESAPQSGTPSPEPDAFGTLADSTSYESPMADQVLTEWGQVGDENSTDSAAYADAQINPSAMDPELTSGSETSFNGLQPLESSVGNTTTSNSYGNAAPSISELSCTTVPNGYLFDGQVNDDEALDGIEIEFGGLLAGHSTTVDADGYFTYTHDPQGTGNVTAVATDSHGADSDEANCVVPPY